MQYREVHESDDDSESGNLFDLAANMVGSFSEGLVSWLDAAVVSDDSDSEEEEYLVHRGDDNGKRTPGYGRALRNHPLTEQNENERRQRVQERAIRDDAYAQLASDRRTCRREFSFCGQSGAFCAQLPS